jgi:protein-S-isoprenylcysteine O-methyltransferase Ste14
MDVIKHQSLTCYSLVECVTRKDMDARTDRAGVVMLPPVLMLAAFVLVLILHHFLPLIIGMPGPMRNLGIALIALGVGSAAWGRTTLVRAGTNVSPLKPTTAIVTGGPFQFTRNPLYVGIMCVFLGLSLIVGTWWGFIVIVPVFLILHFGVVLREERYLAQKFGEPYLAYKQSVRRYF